MKAFTNLSVLFVVILIADTSFQAARKISLAEIQAIENPDYWLELGTEELLATLSTKKNENIAKNIVLFVGDGMGGSTITAARHFKRQTQNKPNLFFESFPFMALTQVRLLCYLKIKNQVFSTILDVLCR